MSETLMVIATIFMAIFSGLTVYLSFRIQQDGTKRDKMMSELIIKLTASVLASGNAVGKEDLAAGLLVRHEEKLREVIAKSKYPLP